MKMLKSGTHSFVSVPYISISNAQQPPPPTSYFLSISPPIPSLSLALLHFIFFFSLFPIVNTSLFIPFLSSLSHHLFPFRSSHIDLLRHFSSPFPPSLFPISPLSFLFLPSPLNNSTTLIKVHIVSTQS